MRGTVEGCAIDAAFAKRHDAAGSCFFQQKAGVSRLSLHCAAETASREPGNEQVSTSVIKSEYIGPRTLSRHPRQQGVNALFTARCHIRVSTSVRELGLELD